MKNVFLPGRCVMWKYPTVNRFNNKQAPTRPLGNKKQKQIETIV